MNKHRDVAYVMGTETTVDATNSMNHKSTFAAESLDFYANRTFLSYLERRGFRFV